MHPVEVLLVPLGRAIRNRRADETASLANAPELATANRLTLTSPAFADGAEIPAKHCSVLIGHDVSPELRWGALPAGTAELLLLLEDLDSPGAVPRIHTAAVLAPDGNGLAEGALAGAGPGIRFLTTGGGRAGYHGPRPLPGHGAHRYRFHVFALDTRIDGVTSTADLSAAVAGHVLAGGTLTGTRES